MGEVVQNRNKVISVMTGPSVDREVCVNKIIFSEFSPVFPITTLFISVCTILSFHSDVISLSIVKIFEISLYFSLNVMFTGNGCTITRTAKLQLAWP